MSVSSSDSVLLHVGDRNDGIALKYAMCDMMVASSKPSVNSSLLLSTSDPNLLHLWEVECAQKYQSASSSHLHPSSSVPVLPQLCENDKNSKHDGFTPVKLKSKVLSWKTDSGAIFSSVPNFFHVRNSPKHNRCKHTSKSKESEEKPRQKEEMVITPKLPHVTQCKDRLPAVDIPSPAVILPRSQSTAQLQIVESQEEVEATREQALYDIQWNFPESRKMSCIHTAKFALNSPLNDDEKLLPCQLRPVSSPADYCKSHSSSVFSVGTL